LIKRSIKIRKSDLVVFTLSFCITVGGLSIYDKVRNPEVNTPESVQTFLGDIQIPESATTQFPKSEGTSDAEDNKTASPKVFPRNPRETTPVDNYKAPDYFEVGESYPWEDDPNRFGLAFTTLPPVATGNTFAIFRLSGPRILVVRADGPVVVRRAIVFHDVTNFEIAENMNGIGFTLICSDGSPRYPIDKFQYRAWTKDEHPASFKFLPLEDGGYPCQRSEASF
jgi:hypothetical protein